MKSEAAQLQLESEPHLPRASRSIPASLGRLPRHDGHRLRSACFSLVRIGAPIRRAELTDSVTKLTRVNDHAIRRTLEAAGIEFIDAEGGGPGVRLRQGQGKAG